MYNQQQRLSRRSISLYKSGFSCACNVGYSDDNLDGTVCSDVDECLNDADNMCNANADCLNTTGSYECTCKAPYWEGEGMDGDDGSAGCTDVDECATGTHYCVSCYGADESDVTPGATERVITTKVSVVIVQLVSGLMKVKCVLTLTNATPTTENAMAMLIASMR